MSQSKDYRNLSLKSQWTNHCKKKVHSRFKRTVNQNFKEKEVIKNAKYQKIADRYKRSMSKKGMGRYKKIKGQVLPKPLDTNSRCVKSWTHVGYGKDKPLKEGFKLYCIFDIT